MSAAKRSIALFGSALVLAFGLVVVFAGSGGAAGVNICPTNDCINASLFPRNLSVNSVGLATGLFTNEANSTATHTSVIVNLPPNTTPVGITSNPSAACDLSTVTCAFGSVAGGSKVKVFVQFSADAVPASNPVTTTATVSFDERNGTSPTNDVVTSAPSQPLTVSASGAVDGNCANTGSVTGKTGVQGISSSISPVDGLPCAPVDAGIDLGSTGVVTGSSDKIAFVDLPLFAGGSLADVTYDLVTLPSGTNVNKFALYEIVGYPTVVVGTPATNPAGFLAVPPCDGLVLPSPTAGLAADACIYSRAKFGSKGIELKLKVLGQGIDPGLWG